MSRFLHRKRSRKSMKSDQKIKSMNGRNTRQKVEHVFAVVKISFDTEKQDTEKNDPPVGAMRLLRANFCV